MMHFPSSVHTTIEYELQICERHCIHQNRHVLLRHLMGGYQLSPDDDFSSIPCCYCCDHDVLFLFLFHEVAGVLCFLEQVGVSAASLRDAFIYGWTAAGKLPDTERDYVARKVEYWEDKCCPNI